FLHIPIPEDQWADMERDPKTGSWTVTIPLKEGASRIDFFSNHGHMANGYQQYLSSPYTRVELSAEAYSKTQRKPAAAPSTNAQAQQPSEKQLAQILKRFPQADTDKDGKLTAEEFKAARQQFQRSRQGNARPAAAAKTKVNSIFNTEEILDENTLETKTLQDWHPVGATRQKLIEINVAQWWPGQDYRIPVRLIVPLEGKAKGFSITGANPYETLMKDARPTDFQAKLLAGGVGIVKTHVKAFRQIPGKQGLEQKMRRVFMKDLNPRYTTLWIWSMTLMRATTAAYAEGDYFEKGKVAGSGSSKNGISPAVALINDERFTATCSDHAFAYYSPTRRGDREARAKADAA
ncbi:MAG: hypothetical protein QGH94_21080, partial [Phycisphaerae bacterium]|nr:hypothetical protein [Phycisphaerae bacterium]